MSRRTDGRQPGHPNRLGRPEPPTYNRVSAHQSFRRVGRSMSRPSAALACLAAVALTGCGTNGRARTACTGQATQFGSYSGYLSEPEPITSVGATWTVPVAAERRSPGATSATWIAAEGGRSRTSPFIQLGTFEEQTAPAGIPGNIIYWAFWTDKAKRFHPIALFPVTPLTEVTARLALSNKRWHLSIRDADAVNGQAAFSFATANEARSSFDIAEWIHEISGSGGGRPTVANIAFTGLSVNGAPPPRHTLRSDWLSRSGVTLGPSILAHDSFAIRPVVLSCAASHYVSIARALPRPALVALGEGLEHWNRRTQQKTVAAVRDRAAAALARFLKSLERAAWPQATQTSFRALVAIYRKILQTLGDAVASSSRRRARWMAALGAEFAVALRAELAVRRVLSAPEIERP
jgi:hypothetical protein